MATMHYTLSGGLLLWILVVTLVVALPVKLAAKFADAQRTGLLWCGGAVAVGLIVGYVASALFGGLIGGPLAGFLGFVLGIRLMLGTGYVAAIGLSVVAFGLSLAAIMLLPRLGLIASGDASAVAI
jgi:hypothetical protein